MKKYPNINVKSTCNNHEGVFGRVILHSLDVWQREALPDQLLSLQIEGLGPDLELDHRLALAGASGGFSHTLDRIDLPKDPLHLSFGGLLEDHQTASSADRPFSRVNFLAGKCLRVLGASSESSFLGNFFWSRAPPGRVLPLLRHCQGPGLTFEGTFWTFEIMKK